MNTPVSSTCLPWRASLALAAVTLLVFGFAYSLVATGIGRLVFADAASGSLVTREGVVVGSTLVAQPFVDERYFHPRPSAAAYAPMAASGSNQARTNSDLRARVDAARMAIASREGISEEVVPSDLVTQSGSGLDPDISPAAARVQAVRVARARGLDAATVARLIEAHVTPARLGLGAPRVNVLALNLALDGTALQQGGQ